MQERTLKELIEREQVLAGVASAIDRADDGNGGAMFVVAEAGLGKTSVLAAAEALAASRMEVHRAEGAAMEGNLPFGLAAQAFPSVGALMQPGAEPALDPSAPLMRALRWLEQRDREPLLFVLDDLHWSDPDSLRLLTFLTRRLEGLPVALIGALRPWPEEAQGAVRALAETGHASIHALAPLSPPGVAAVLAGEAGRAADDAEGARVWEQSNGNPLLIEHMARALRDGDAVPEAGDLGSRMLLTRFAGLDHESMRCARAASAMGAGFRLEIAGEAADLDGSALDVALEALHRSGLISEGIDGTARFSHPLFGQSLYEDTAPAQRRRLHERLFDAYASRGMTREAAGHAIEADLRGSDRAVSACAQAGRAAIASGAVATATTLLEAAVTFSVPEAEPNLLLDLAEALTVAARLDDGRDACRRLLARPAIEDANRIRALRILGRAGYLAGEPDHGEAAMREAVAIARGSAPALAIEPLLDRSLAAWLATGIGPALALAESARDLAADYGDDMLRDRAAAVWSHMALESGDGSGLAVTDEIRRRLQGPERAALLDPAEVVWPWAPVHQYAQNCVGAERFDEAESIWIEAHRAAESAGAAQMLGVVAIWLANLRIRRGRLSDALADAVRADAFAELTPGIQPYPALARAEALLWSGRLDESEAVCATAEEAAAGQWFAGVWISHVRGLRLLWDGDPIASDILLDAERLTLAADVGEPCHVQWAAHAVAAHLAVGRGEDAERVVSWLEACSAGIPCRWPRFAAALGRGRLAEHEGDLERADRLYAESAECIRPAGMPLQEAEALLARGGMLRRGGRPTEARPHLSRAAELCESAGAQALAEVARSELKLAGGRRRRRVRDRDDLTPAELRVAMLAAEGHSNAAIAACLFVSENTVATHLKHVYAKLGINSRRRLMTRRSELARLGEEGEEDHPNRGR